MISEVFTVERERDEVMIEVRPGRVDPDKGLTQQEWNAYVVDAVRRWVNKRPDGDDGSRIPF
jgi:hypothetical protein